jgi:plastocyanin
MRNLHLLGHLSERRAPGTRCLVAWLASALVGAWAAPASAADPEFTIRIKDHKFDPAELRIPAGTKVKVIIDNQEDEQEEFESYTLNREKHVPPRSKAVLFIGPLDSGRYVYQGENHSGSGAALGVIVAK